MQEEFCDDCACMRPHEKIWEENEYIKLGETHILTYVKYLQCQECGTTQADESD